MTFIKMVKKSVLFLILTIFIISVTTSCAKTGSTDQSAGGEVAQLTEPSAAVSNLDEIKKLLLGKSSGQEGAVTVDIFLATPKFFRAFAAVEAEEQGKSEEEVYESYKDRYSFDEFLVFAIDLNTHSVDLSSYKMEDISTLRDNQGNLYSPVEWRELGESSSSHHRSGALLFSLANKEGNPVISEATRYIEVIIKDIAGVKERTFKWELPIKYPESS
ncbi:MAG: hypothetical protein M1371_02290 [Actinobacteria bacterium]|nr:hypothetical protein [Actinomycetota bacterium]